MFTALDKGFEQLDTLGAQKKALIFTESRRTQEFLYELLEKRGYKGKVVRFNGTNTDHQSTEIYKAWMEKHKGSHKITGSPTADRRAAIVDYFREEGTIMIATEAALRGAQLKIHIKAIDDEFVAHGSIKDINNLYGFTAEKISGDIERMLKS